MKREDFPYILCGIILFFVAGVFAAPSIIEHFRPPSPTPQVSVPKTAMADLDRASERMKGLIESQQSKLAGHVFLADAGLFDSAELKTDISVKVKYLLWQIEVSIALQRIENGKPPGKVPGMSVGEPVGSTNK